MATVYFAPYKAVKYVGTKHKTLATSTARPKPELKRGDIVIVDKVSAFNMVQKGFGEFEDVESIAFVKADKERAAEVLELELRIADLEKENAMLSDQVELFQKELSELTEVSEEVLPGQDSEGSESVTDDGDETVPPETDEGAAGAAKDDE